MRNKFKIASQSLHCVQLIRCLFDRRTLPWWWHLHDGFVSAQPQRRVGHKVKAVIGGWSCREPRGPPETIAGARVQIKETAGPFYCSNVPNYWIVTLWSLKKLQIYAAARIMFINNTMSKQISLEWEEKGLISVAAIILCEKCLDVTVYFMWKHTLPSHFFLLKSYTW